MTQAHARSAYDTSAYDKTVTFVLGTRPEIVKLAPLVRRFGETARVVHTGQHYDSAMSEVFFANCAMRLPDAILAVGGASRADQIGRSVQALGALFEQDRPAVIVVQGDTSSALAGALAANALDVPLAHVEAGLRSFDRRMPEEHNRVIIDHLADVLCAPTPGNVANLLAESIPPERIELTGNTVIKALADALPPAELRAKTLADVGVRSAGFVLATIHRPENTDDPAILHAVLGQLGEIARAGWPVVFPVHPRTRATILRHGLSFALSELVSCDPLGYLDFLSLAAECALLVSDSGGIQEEATVLGRPLIVVRRSTERPEALADFADLIPPGPAVSTRALRVLADVEAVHARLAKLPSPFGDVNAVQHAERAVRSLVSI